MGQKTEAAARDRSRRAIACVALSAMVLVAGVWLLIDAAVGRLVLAETERTGRTAATYLFNSLPDLPEIVSGTAPLPERGLVAQVKSAGSITRFRLFDGRGRPVFDSASAADPPTAATEPDASALQTLERERPLARMEKAEEPGEPPREGRIYIPVFKNGTVAGALAIHVDTAESHAVMREIFGLTVPMLIGLLLLVFGLPTLLLMHRNREMVRDRVEAESRSELARSRDEAARLASTDPLTGLLNRAALSCAFDDRRRLLDDRDMVLTLMLIDVDHLTAINDGDGYEQGDQVLRSLGDILAGWSREGDAAGRLGGDEFLLVLTAPRYQSPGARLAERLLRRMEEQEKFRGLSVPVSLSIGITTIWKATTSFAEALRQADLALQEAKRRGRGRMTLYEPAMAERYDRRTTVLRQVRDALAAGQIVPSYQPLVSLADRRVVGVEVLARWRQADGTTLRSGRFAEAFEDPRLASAISALMLEAGAEACGRLLAGKIPFGRLAVNVTEAQLADPKFTEHLLDTLLAHGLSAGELAVELTETVLLSHREAAILKTLEALEEAGAVIALDDFGTGFASLTHLRRFPVHQVKLDLSFIRRIALEPQAHAISAAMISMAHALDIRVVAEGVQTAEIDAMLRELKCDYAQGYFYAPPGPIEDLSKLLKQGLAA